MIGKIQSDFENGEGPFENKAELLPERAVLDENPDINTRRTAFLTYGCMLDYNRNAANLWQNCLELWQRDTDYFDPREAAEMSQDSLSAVMSDIGFRYPNRDADGWIRNSEIVCEEHEGSWAMLILDSHRDAEQLAENIEEEGYKYLGGEKLKPFYCKVIHENVAELDNIWTLEIPVDVHIRRLTQDLAGNELSDDEIREFWRVQGHQDDISPMVVDGALWLIGNNWDDWGEQYWEELQDE